MRLTTILAAAWLSALLALSGDGFSQPAEKEKPVTGDWLVLHELSDPEQLNPVTSSDYTASVVLGHIVESLLGRDPRTLELKPLIAESRPEISKDKLAYTFKIRRDARFQDGRPLTGEDVLFSLKTIKCPLVNAPFARVYFNSVVDAELPDPYTIRFIIQEPYFLNESVLGENLIVMPRHYYDPENLLGKISVRDMLQNPSKMPANIKNFADHFNKSYNRSVLGSGPYKFNGWKTGQEVELVRDPKYWGNGKAGIDQAYLDRIKFRIINNMDAALVTLKSGGLDVMDPITPVQHTRGTGSERFKREFQKLEYFMPAYSHIGWNNEHPIFKDKRVRQAMTYLTDRQLMIKSILFGLGQAVDGPVYFFRPEYEKNLYSHPYDPKKAIDLLREAGWKDSDGDGVLDKIINGKKTPFRFELKLNSGSSTGKSVALVFQEELKKHGIVAAVREIDWTIFLDDTKHHKFDAVLMAWAFQASEPDDYQVWHSSQAPPPGSNHVSYKNPRVDKILENYRREFDPDKRIELYREFQRILNEDQPYTFLFARKYVAAVQRRFRGVVVYPEGVRPRARPPEWWVPLAEQRYPRKGTAAKIMAP